MVASLAERKPPLRANSGRLAVEALSIVPFTWTAASMGGRLEVHLDAEGRTLRRGKMPGV